MKNRKSLTKKIFKWSKDKFANLNIFFVVHAKYWTHEMW